MTVRLMLMVNVRMIQRVLKTMTMTMLLLLVIPFEA